MGSWYYSLLVTISRLNPTAERKSLESELGQLGVLMSHPIPDQVEVARSADQAATMVERLSRTVASSSYDADRVRGLAADVARLRVSNWDSAAQQYLGLIALTKALGELQGGGDDPMWTKQLERFREFLRYPPGFNSPRGFDFSRISEGRTP
jgi:hypothetical protein